MFWIFIFINDLGDVREMQKVYDYVYRKKIYIIRNIRKIKDFIYVQLNDGFYY